MIHSSKQLDVAIRSAAVRGNTQWHVVVHGMEYVGELPLLQLRLLQNDYRYGQSDKAAKLACPLPFFCAPIPTAKTKVPNVQAGSN